MSRIGVKPIPLPQGVTVKIVDRLVAVTGPKGSLSQTIHRAIAVEQHDNQLIVKIDSAASQGNVANFHGLTRSLVNNMVLGVSQGFAKSLQLIGVGYRAQVKGKELHLNLGFSHDVVYPLPQGIECTVEKNTLCTFTGIDKELVGQVAATIRAYRKPEPYHGKGIRYSDERVVLKAGKSAKK